MQRSRLIVAGALTGVLIAGLLMAVRVQRPYTSTAVIRIAPAVIPERFVATEKIALDRISTGVLQTILSRGNLTNIINLYNLYPAERSRMPMEDVIEIMRRSVEVKNVNETSLEISFTHSDRITTQKIAADLVSRIMTEYLRVRETQAIMTLAFMKDSANAAAAEWEASLARLRAAPTGGHSMDRVKLDSEIARGRYEALSGKVAEAQMMVSLEKRQQAATLEVLEPASLPTDSRPSIWLWLMGGAAIGAFVGWIVSLLRAPGEQREVAHAL